MPIEINCDAGEISKEIDDSILPFVSSCNVCCGAHAGSPELIEGTIQKAIELGINVGAHPSWPDRENFGRRSMELPLSELKASLLEQILSVKQITQSNGGVLHHVKPHGALYHDVLRNPEIASLVLDVVSEIDSNLVVYGLAGSSFATKTDQHQLRFAHETFGDRCYESAFELRDRTRNDALIETESDFCDHFKQLLSGCVVDIHGQTHRLPVHTICLHSDTPNAINFARLAHGILKEENNRTDSE